METVVEESFRDILGHGRVTSGHAWVTRTSKAARPSGRAVGRQHLRGPPAATAARGAAATLAADSARCWRCGQPPNLREWPRKSTFKPTFPNPTRENENNCIIHSSDMSHILYYILHKPMRFLVKVALPPTQGNTYIAGAGRRGRTRRRTQPTAATTMAAPTTRWPGRRRRRSSHTGRPAPSTPEAGSPRPATTDFAS